MSETKDSANDSLSRRKQPLSWGELRKKFFSFQGRIGLASFYVVCLWALALYGLPLILVERVKDLYGVLSIALLVPCVWVWAAATVKRAQDLGISPIWNFVPVANLVLLLALAGWPGKNEANKYGAA